MILGFVNKREGLSTLSLSNAALLVRGFFPTRDFSQTFSIANLAGRQVSRDGLGGCAAPRFHVNEPKKDGCAKRWPKLSGFRVKKYCTVATLQPQFTSHPA